MLNTLPILLMLAYEAVDHRHSLATIVSRVSILSIYRILTVQRLLIGLEALQLGNRSLILHIAGIQR